MKKLKPLARLATLFGIGFIFCSAHIIAEEKYRIVSFNIDNRSGIYQTKHIDIYQCTDKKCTPASRLLLGTVSPNSLGDGWRVSSSSDESAKSVKQVLLLPHTRESSDESVICTVDLTRADSYIIIVPPETHEGRSCGIISIP